MSSMDKPSLSVVRRDRYARKLRNEAGNEFVPRAD
jgi:hypothetical protein